MSVSRPSDPAERLAEIEHEWVELNARRRRLSDERIRAVWAASDSGMSHREVARAMSFEGHQVDKSYPPKILACGYPEEAPD